MDEGTDCRFAARILSLHFYDSILINNRIVCRHVIAACFKHCRRSLAYAPHYGEKEGGCDEKFFVHKIWIKGLY